MTREDQSGGMPGQGDGEPTGDFLGYFRYSGKLVESGFLDARKSAQVLLGMDKALRHYMGSIAPELKEAEFDLPVRVRRGSWEAWLPDTLAQWLLTGAGAAFTAYTVSAAKKAAENDIGERGLKDLVRSALHGVHWFIKIGKHLGDVERKRFEDLKVDSEKMLIGIPNETGEILWLPKFHYDIFQSTPPLVLADVTSIIEAERVLTVGVVEEEGAVEETIDQASRSIFSGEDEEEEILFPELEHGMAVELEGKVTRGNGETNTIGFKYRDHILTCLPLNGSIVRFKPVLFTDATITGTITRADDVGEISAIRPKIIFSDLVAISRPKGQRSLF